MICLKPTNIKCNTIQIYAPTVETCEDDIETFHHQLGIIMQRTKHHDLNIRIGEFNTKVGNIKTWLEITGWEIGT